MKSNPLGNCTKLFISTENICTIEETGCSATGGDHFKQNMEKDSRARLMNDMAVRSAVWCEIPTLCKKGFRNL